MNRLEKLRGGSGRLATAAVAAGAGSVPGAAWACATCYGQSDSPLAAGMNWGIFSLLALIVMVLGGVAAFFVFLARRASASIEISGEPSPLGPVQRPELETQHG